MIRKILYLSLAASILINVLHVLALHFDLYWRVWWYDIPLHVLAGIVLGGLALWLVYSLQNKFPPRLSERKFVIFVFLLIFLGGASWEVFEYSLGYTWNTIGSYPLDVAKDLFMDLVGGTFALLYYQRLEARAYRGERY